jgi:hypothetical protein
MYQSPLTLEEIKERYPDKARVLCSDSVHHWRATTGIELVHKEPSREERVRIWENWQEMSEEQKRLSDKKSLELFGMTNEEHQKKIEKEYTEKNIIL